MKLGTFMMPLHPPEKDRTELQQRGYRGRSARARAHSLAHLAQHPRRR